MRRHSHSPVNPPVSAYGSTGEYAAWRAVLAAYEADRLEEAFEAAKDLGAGTLGFGLHTFRMIEAERFTRVQSAMVSIEEGLDLEFVEEEVPRWSEPARIAQESLQGTAKALGLNRTIPILLTVLAAAANTPWTPGRHGFCAAKTGFAKVCLPHDLLSDPRELGTALRHEFAHALALEAAAGLCPMWLDEAVAMAVAGEADPHVGRRFRQGSIPWLPEAKLDAAFRGDRESTNGQQAVWAAYQQSALIGGYLVRAGGTTSLGRLLQAHRLGGLPRFMAMLRGERTSDTALRAVYGCPARELLKKVKGSL
jgi:hypothetical protein